MNADDLRNKREENHRKKVDKFVNNILDKANADAQHWNYTQYEVPVELKEDIIKHLKDKDFEVDYIDLLNDYSLLKIKW